MADMAALVESVKAHAMAHYEEPGGWDYVIECFDDAKIVELIVEAEASTPEAAIAAVGWLADALGDRRADVVAEIF